MKKLFILLTTAVFLLCTACSQQSQNEITHSTTEDGNRVTISKSNTTVFFEELPAELSYNEKEISITSVSAYQGYSKNSYSYVLFIIVRLDVENLEDDELHWLRESDLNMDVFLTSTENDYDFDRMNPLGNLLTADKNEICFVFTSSFFKENRHAFDGSKITVTQSVEIEETYEYVDNDNDVHNLHKTNGLHYNMVLPNDMPSPEEIEAPLYGWIAEWLSNEAQFYFEMMQ